ncbi:MAG TPA: hypothetical protein VFJ97_15465 [Dermatophilaceae bacterium]|nr:hypothetical protein [Dermatophilaceae bacterium]
MRSFVAAIFVVVGGLLVAASVPVAWAHSIVTDADRFVDATRPLSQDPGVQRAVASVVSQELTGALEQVDLTPVQLPPALRRLAQSPDGAVARLITRTVQAYVTTPGFRDLWPTLVRSAHDSLVASLTLGSARTVTVDLAPVVAQIRSQLVTAGLPAIVAAAVPTGAVQIGVSRVGALASLRDYTATLDPASVLLPVSGALVLLLGLAVARRRLWALAGATLVVAAGLGAVFVAIRVAKPYAVRDLVPALLPASSRAAVYDAVTSDLRVWLFYAVLGTGAVLTLTVVLMALARARRLAA